MKTLVRSLFLSGLVLYIAMLIYPGMKYDGSITTLAVAALALMLLDRIVKPMIKLLLLPINLITLGLFSWVAHVASLFLLTKIVGGFRVVAFHFGGLNWNGFIVPASEVNLLMSFVLGSVVVSLIASTLRWILRD